MTPELIQLRDLVADANRELHDVHTVTKGLLARGYVEGLVRANEKLLAALKVIRKIGEKR